VPATQDQLKVSGRAIKAARLRRGLTLRQLSALCAEAEDGRPVTAGQISRYERGRIRPAPASLLALAQALDVQTDDLLETSTG